MISRYEIKFRVTHEQRERFLAAAKPGLVEDPHGKDACYRVSSVYYDSPRFDLYWEKIDGIALRRKLRLRFYDELKSPDQLQDQVFFLEIKHRIKDSVCKERVRLKPEGGLAILQNSDELAILREYVLEEDLQFHLTVSLMEWMQSSLKCKAANTISYLREAWMGKVDDRVRITFDHAACTYSPDSYSKVGQEPGFALIPEEESIMEIKFNQSIPRWLRDIVAEQGLTPRRYSKYASGIDRLWKPLESLQTSV